jgi:hypothetical protein
MPSVCGCWVVVTAPLATRSLASTACAASLRCRKPWLAISASNRAMVALAAANSPARSEEGSCCCCWVSWAETGRSTAAAGCGVGELNGGGEESNCALQVLVAVVKGEWVSYVALGGCRSAFAGFARLQVHDADLALADRVLVGFFDVGPLCTLDAACWGGTGGSRSERRWWPPGPP